MHYCIKLGKNVIFLFFLDILRKIMYNILLCYITILRLEKVVKKAGFFKSLFVNRVTTAK